MWKDNFSFVTGALSATSVGFMALSLDSVDDSDPEFSQLAFWHEGKWGNNGQTDFPVISITFCAHPIKQVLSMSPIGEVFLTGSGDVHQEQIRDGTEIPQVRGMLRCIRAIEGIAFAVGMHRQVYRRDGQNLWTCIDQQMRPSGKNVLGFEAVDGFGLKEIYAAGWEGEIWRFDGQNWHRIASPTNFVLTDICCAGNGQVYACGRVGMLLIGRDDVWSVIEHGNMIEDIWSLAWFKGYLYAATYQGLFRLVNTRLEVVDMGDDIPTSFYKLSANNDVLWSIGSKDIMAFDGSAWTRIE